MPCHARAAAPPTQALSYLWISDDLLCDAFNRFARVSRTARRYGSNVPGPLEARRRFAKRRMGMVATSAAVTAPSPGYDLSVLLGFRSSTPVDQGWTWEAPNHYDAATFGLPPPPPPPPLFWPWSPGQKAVNRVRRGVLEAAQKVDPVAVSKKGFNGLLDAIPQDKAASIAEIKSLVGFLQSSGDEPQAHNVVRLTQWLDSQTVDRKAAELLDQVICDKLALEVLDCDDVSNYIGHILQKPIGDGVLRIAALLNSSAVNSLQDVACSVTKDCLSRAAKNGSDNGTEMIAVWLHALRECTHLQGLHHNSFIWAAVYSILATRLQPSNLASHLSTLDLPDLGRVLLRTWVPALFSAAQQDVASQRGFRWSNQSSIEAGCCDINTMVADYNTEQARHRGTGQIYHPLVNLIVVLSRHHVPYNHLFIEIFEILRATSDIRGDSGKLRRVIKFVMGVRQHREIDIPEPHTVHLIDYFLNGGNEITRLRAAWHIFMQSPTVPLSQFPGLALRMAEAGAGPQEIFQLLQRRGRDSVSLEFRSNHRLRLKQEHINLVHILAHKWAHHPKSTCRIAFRRVWACYRYLQDRGAPLTDTMSRAMFHAGALRYLLEGRRVATEQFRYILSLVRRLEGDAIADELDRSIWMFWKQQVQPQELLERVRRLCDSPADGVAVDFPTAAATIWKENKPWRRLSTERSTRDIRLPQQLYASLERSADAKDPAFQVTSSPSVAVRTE